MADQLRMDAVVNDRATGPLRRIREELATFRESEGMKSLASNMTLLRQQTGEFTKAASAASGVMGGIGVVGLGASLSIGKLVETFGALAKRSGDLKSISQETGLSMAAIDRFGKVASRFGIDRDEMHGALRTWGDKMIDLRRHTGEIFGKLHNQKGGAQLIEKLLGENPEAQIQDIFRFIGGLAPQMRARFSQLFFGDANISHLTRDGVKALEDALSQIKAAQGSFGPDLLAQQQAYQDSLTKFNTSLENFNNKSGPAFLAMMAKVLDKAASLFPTDKQVEERRISQYEGGKKDERERMGPQPSREKLREWLSRPAPPTYTAPNTDGNALHRNDETPAAPKREGADRGWFGWLRHDSAYREDGQDDRQLTRTSLGARAPMGAGASILQDMIQRGTRLGVLQGLQDYADMRSAQAGGAGGGFQNASFTTFGSGKGGGATSSFDARPFQQRIGKKNAAEVMEHVDFIRKTAAALGINPDYALKVAGNEGLYASHAGGDYGTSFGDFLMHYGGSGIRGMNASGLGDLFNKMHPGIDGKDPKNWKALDRFALEMARRQGWGPWHGAARIGITGRMGIGAMPSGVSLPDAAPSDSSAAKLARPTSPSGVPKGARWGQDIYGNPQLYDQAGYPIEANGKRPSIWENAKKAGVKPEGEQTVTHKGGAEITIKGLPQGTRTHTRTQGLIDSVRLERSSTMPNLAWE